MISKPAVVVVHCVDTEGPLNETLEATFQRISEIFGRTIAPSEENLLKLQTSQFDLGGLEPAIAGLVNEKRLKYRRNWHELSGAYEKIESSNIRHNLPDSFGNGWIFNWFCVDHVGYSGSNPRERTVGHHQIFDHYVNLVHQSKSADSVHWHYHPLPTTGDLTGSGSGYLNSTNVLDVLCRKVIERGWFPSAFRPGFHTERPDSHWLLEQWIPFDYGSQACSVDNQDQPDLSDGRWGDWSRAPRNWFPYHPSHDDYQVPGGCRRWITRCLAMESRIREITKENVLEAFREGTSEQPALLSFCNHDYRDMESEILKIQGFIRLASIKYPQKQFMYAEAVNGMRRVLNLSPDSFELNARITSSNSSTKRLEVNVDGKLFGTQPFLAIGLQEHRFIWQNFDQLGSNRWSFTFDENDIPWRLVESIGVAGNSMDGQTIVQRLLANTEFVESRHN